MIVEENAPGMHGAERRGSYRSKVTEVRGRRQRRRSMWRGGGGVSTRESLRFCTNCRGKKSHQMKRDFVEKEGRESRKERRRADGGNLRGES